MSLKTNKNPSSDKAFTLLELAVVFAIVGFVLVMTISFLKPYYAEKVALKNAAALQTVEDALSRYVAKQGKYPCPASPSAARGTADDGLALCSATKGILSADGTRDPASKVLIGAVPYRELNIPASSTVDGYFNRLTYAVSQKSTETSTYSDVDTAPPGQIAPLSGQIRILSTDDPANKTSLTRIAGGAHYFVFSRGQNGAGAYTDSGALKAGNCPANEAENCNNDSTFVSARLALGSGNRYFDDVSKFNLPISYTSGDEAHPATSSSSEAQKQLWTYGHLNRDRVTFGKVTSHTEALHHIRDLENIVPSVSISDRPVDVPMMMTAAPIKIGATPRLDCSDASEGALRYNKYIKKMEFCDGNIWQNFDNPCVGKLKEDKANKAVVNYSRPQRSPSYDANNNMWGYMDSIAIDTKACQARVQYSCGIQGRGGASYAWVNFKDDENKILYTAYLCSYKINGVPNAAVANWNQPQLDRQFFRFGGTDTKDSTSLLIAKYLPLPEEATKAEIYVSGQGLQSSASNPPANPPADKDTVTAKMIITLLKEE